MPTDPDDKKFNETLKNLLSTPPSKHADEKHPRKSAKPPPKKKAAKKKPA